MFTPAWGLPPAVFVYPPTCLMTSRTAFFFGVAISGGQTTPPPPLPGPLVGPRLKWCQTHEIMQGAELDYPVLESNLNTKL